MSSDIVVTTAEQLLAMRDDGRRYELINGELSMMSPAGSRHGRVAARLSARIQVFVEQHNMGVVFAAETGFLISRDPDTVRAPDVAFVRQGRADQVGDVEGYWPGPPDLAVEVVSTNDTYSNVEKKALDWLAAGTHRVWVVDPAQRNVTVYRGRDNIIVLDADSSLDGETVLPGWTLSLADLFR